MQLDPVVMPANFVALPEATWALCSNGARVTSATIVSQTGWTNCSRIRSMNYFTMTPFIRLDALRF